MKLKFLPIFVYLFIMSSSVMAQKYYEVLPKGVRTFVFRNIQATASSSYNQTQSETPYSYTLNTNIENIKDLDIGLVQDALELLEPYPDAYNKVSFGSHFFKAQADLNVDAYGFGVGLTDKVSFYLGFPIYQADVRFKYKRTKGSSTKEVAEALQQETDDDYAQTLGNIIEQLYDLDGGVLQSALVNEFNYNELGDWRGEGIGDTELGLMYKFYDTGDSGLKLTLGGVLPTGAVDDPDTLQDIGFGDGQPDAFIEIGGGKRLNASNYVNSWLRYTYQFSSNKRLRVLEYEDFALAYDTDEFEEKLGNKIDFDIDHVYVYNDWLNFQTALLANYTEKARYKSEHSKANKLLAKDTDSYQLNLRLSTNLSTVTLYKKGTFLIPGEFNLGYQTVLEGRNTPKVSRTELEFRMYF